MKNFLDKDFLLESETAKKLFHIGQKKCLFAITTAI